MNGVTVGASRDDYVDNWRRYLAAFTAEQRAAYVRLLARKRRYRDITTLIKAEAVACVVADFAALRREGRRP